MWVCRLVGSVRVEDRNDMLQFYVDPGPPLSPLRANVFSGVLEFCMLGFVLGLSLMQSWEQP
jgi:hypothetical protein